MHLPYKLFELGHPQIPENVRPHSSNSIENATHYSQSSCKKGAPFSSTSPLAYYLEVPPPPSGINCCQLN